MAIAGYTGPKSTRVARTLSYPFPEWRPAEIFQRMRSVAIVRSDKAIAGRHPDYGFGSIRDTVAKKGVPTNVPLRRLVRLYRDDDGQLLRSTWSDATTGAYAFELLPTEFAYTVVAYDYEHGFRAAIADNLPAEVL